MIGAAALVTISPGVVIIFETNHVDGFIIKDEILHTFATCIRVIFVHLIHDLVNVHRIVGHVANDVLDDIVYLQRIGTFIRRVHIRIAASKDLITLVEQLLGRCHIVESPLRMLRIEGHEQFAHMHRYSIVIENVNQSICLVDSILSKVEMMLLLHLDAEKFVGQYSHNIEHGITDVGEQGIDMWQDRKEGHIGVMIVLFLRSLQHRLASCFPIVYIGQG